MAKKASVKRTSPYAPFEEEIIRTVLAPRIGEVIQQQKPESLKALCDVWHDLHGPVSTSTMKEWLTTLGVVTTRRTVFEAPVSDPQLELSFSDPDELLTDPPHRATGPNINPAHGGIVQ